jgi:hypothetical protein
MTDVEEREATPEEAARLLPFTLFVAPWSWHQRLTLYGAQPSTARLALERPEGGQVVVNEGEEQGGVLTPVMRRTVQIEEHRRGNLRLHVWRGTDLSTVVEVTRDGTDIQLVSHELDADELIELALSLIPAE